MSKRTIQRVVEWGLVVVVVGWLAASVARPMVAAQDAGGFDIRAFGKLPVSYGGRFKPTDTVARNALTILSGRQTVEMDGEQLSATRWLLDVLARPEAAAQYPVFRIDNPEVRSLIGIGEADGKRFSYAQIGPGLDRLFAVARQAEAVDKARRSAFQNQVLKLAGDVQTFLEIANQISIHAVPIPGADELADWESIRAASQRAHQAQAATPVLNDYMNIYTAYSDKDPARFNAAVASLHATLKTQFPQTHRKSLVEWRFNLVAPFSKAMVAYLIAALLIFISWIVMPDALRGAALKVMVVALLIHTVALAARVYLSGRPPVTNLYSSAVFIGWGVVGLSFVIEAVTKRGFGLIVGAVIGFATLLIAQGLSADGDTMAVLQAVLDTNFWLATHVIVITLGYVGAYVAGGLGALYVLAGVLTRALDRDTSRRLAQSIYGVVCFALLLSFIGTILGGIWADQSWGRFWGWDPKENGALMIVLWNAIILHARWGGIVRQRGLAVMAILGNIVTSWSWFGVNMLGAGLHSYGFTDAGAGGLMQKLMNPGPKEWLLLFVTSQLILVAIGTIPREAWRSGEEIRR